MIKLYSPAGAERRIHGCGELLRDIQARYRVPAACLRAILYNEMTEMDLLDVAADLSVRFYWARFDLRSRLCTRGLLKDRTPVLRAGPLGKRDSSTGWAQIFSYVGINACRFAFDRGLAAPASLGLPEDRTLDPRDPEDLRAVWLRLNRDREFNLRLAAFNLLAAAEQMTGRMDFDGCSPEELRRIFTRYNADTDRVTAYGERAYANYLRYRAAEQHTDGG
ncbi:MAG: hypothetical protein IJU29_06350 [Oscillospiraceae bacterium]|nr:hypothetical protein [Oscillospiraceae bacterium]